MSKIKRRIIAVDVDGTLCENAEWWRGIPLVPKVKNIAKINDLFDKGNYIIIYTARKRADEFITKDWLDKQGVKYHAIVMDKLSADIYLDDKALNEKDIQLL